MTKLSLRGAINANCRNCIHDPVGGGGQWREQVEACSSSNCALHPVRPRSLRKAEKPVSEPKDAVPEPEPTDAAGQGVSALAGDALPRDGATSG